MAEFVYPEAQEVTYGQSALLNNTTCGCGGNGCINHMNGFGGITVKGPANSSCSNYARYEAKYAANIALAEGATVGEIGVAFSINGEVVQDTVASATPSAVGNFWHVSGFKTFDIPKGCCPMIAVENVSPSAGTTPNPNIIIKNLNVAVNRLPRNGG